MRRLSATIYAGIFALLAVMSVQGQMGPATPAPELKKLDFMAGDWTSEGDMKPGPGMPGGKFSISSHAEWMEGNFFLVEHSNADMAAMGKFKELAVIGYDPDRKVYTYHAFNSMGQDENSVGTVDGDTWTWLSDEHFGGTTMKGRFTMKVLSPTSYTMKFELSQDGTSWMTGMEGKATKGGSGRHSGLAPASLDQFIGSWKLNPEKSTQAPEKDLITIERQDSALRITEDVAYGNGTELNYWTLTEMNGAFGNLTQTNGKPMNEKWRVTRDGANGFVVESAPFPMTTKYAVSADGQSLIARQVVSASSGIVGAKIENGTINRGGKIEDATVDRVTTTTIRVFDRVN